MSSAPGNEVSTGADRVATSGRARPSDIGRHPRFSVARPAQVVERAAFTSRGMGLGGKGAVLHRTYDFFQTMEPVDRMSTGQTCHLVFVDSRDHIYWNAVGDGELRRSIDGGDTWTTVLRLRAHHDRGLWRMCEQPTTGYLFAGEHTAGHAVSCRVHRSRDGGETWSEVLFVPGERHVHAVHSTGDGALYAATGDSLGILYRSSDDGNTWQIVNAGRGLGAIASCGTTLLLGSNGGWSSDIWKSRDGGTTWETRFHQTPRRSVSWMRHFGQGVFLASHALNAVTPPGVPAELLLSEDGGESWAAVYRWDAGTARAGSWRASNVYRGWMHLSDEHGLNLLVTPVAASPLLAGPAREAAIAAPSGVMERVD